MLNPWRDEPGPLHDARCAVHDTDLPCSCAADDERLDPRNVYLPMPEAGSTAERLDDLDVDLPCAGDAA